MKVIHVCESVTGGIATYLNELIPHQVNIYGIENVRVIVAKEQMGELTIPPSIIRTFDVLNRKSVKAQWRMASAYFRHLREFEPTTVHLHSTFAGFWFRLPLLFPTKKLFKVIYCSHGWAFDMQKPMWVKKIFALIENLLSVCTDRIVCISEHDKNSAIKFGLSAKKLTTVRNTVEIADKNITAANMNEKTINYLYVGRFDQQKGFDILSQAVRQSMNGDFRIYCIGGAVVSDTTTTDVFKDPRLILLGWKPKQEVLQYMKGCDALLVPSRWEGFGLVALEALVCGCPVFHSGAGGLAEILPDSEFSTQLEQPIEISLIKLLNTMNKDFLQKLKQRLDDGFELDYTVKDLAESLDRIYAS